MPGVEWGPLCFGGQMQLSRLPLVLAFELQAVLLDNLLMCTSS
jgi:hypothetical protein